MTACEYLSEIHFQLPAMYSSLLSTLPLWTCPVLLLAGLNGIVAPALVPG